jgi:hypothetical protein
VAAEVGAVLSVGTVVGISLGRPVETRLGRVDGAVDGRTLGTKVVGIGFDVDESICVGSSESVVAVVVVSVGVLLGN